MAILGMVVALQTFNSEDAGTDDEIYLGMWGTGGGREFPLSSANHDDFERNADDFYILGVDPGFGFPMHRSERSAPGQDNDPALLPIDINSIQYVYLRKQAYGQDQDDDAHSGPVSHLPGPTPARESKFHLSIEARYRRRNSGPEARAKP